MSQSLKTKKNRYYPPEWEKQKCTWLSWPHNEKEWGKKRLPGIRKFYIDLISKILHFQDVNLILPDEKILFGMKSMFSQKKSKHNLKGIIVPNNDIWIRDYGPFFMKETCGRKSLQRIIDFEFNSYGGKFPPWDKDNKVPKEIASYYQREIESYPLVMEGGSLEFSGDGVILTTEQCLLNKKRNPKLKKEQIEYFLKSAFNVNDVIWLKRGLEGDHTDGHIDDFARFVGERKVLLCQTDDSTDANFRHLRESKMYLKKWRHPKKKYKLEVIDLPMPDRMEIKKKRLPNSYANFIFINGGVIVPIFNCETDKEALKIFKKVFPKRKIVGIDATLLIQEGGGIHCMTKQEPA
jgi:agmatine deiminase